MRAHEFIDEGWKTKAAAGAAAAAMTVGALKYKNDDAPPSPSRQTHAGLVKPEKNFEKSTEEYLKNQLAKIGKKGAELAQFMAQASHETRGFNDIEENLNYTSPERLVKIFPSSFPTVDSAKPYVNNPEAIANRVYANQLGNGNEESGDGWKYRGRGYLHLTGRENYRKAGEALGIPLEQHPGFAARPDIALKTSVWYWENRVKPKVKSFANVQQSTQSINPSMIGISDRNKQFAKYSQPASPSPGTVKYKQPQTHK